MHSVILVYKQVLFMFFSINVLFFESCNNISFYTSYVWLAVQLSW